ncbi:MAG: hypothetical protein ACM65L_22665 [Microcoleus sp.]
MSAEQMLAYDESIEIARWLSPLPEIESRFAPSPPTFFDRAGLDQGLGNTFGTDGSALPDLGPLSPLDNWGSVAAVIDRKAQQLANFDPTATDHDNAIWQAYATKFGTIPFWLQTTKQDRTVQISSLSLDAAVNAVDDLVKGIATESTFNIVVDSIKKIAELAIQNRSSEQKNNFQQQGILSVKSSQLYSGYLRTSVAMRYKSGKGYEQITQSISVQQFYGVLDLAKCKRNAETILGWDNTDVDEWERDTSSAPFPPNQSPAWNN